MSQVTLPKRPACSKFTLFLDGRRGRRLGRHGLPDVSGSEQVTSPWLGQLMDRLESYAVARRMLAEESVVLQLSWIQALPPRREEADRLHAECKLKLHEIETEGVAKGPRIGEELMDAAFVVLRRRREYDALRAQAKAELESAASKLTSLEVREQESLHEIEMAREAAETDIEDAVHATRTRWGRYVEGVVATHPYPESLRNRLPLEAPTPNEAR